MSARPQPRRRFRDADESRARILAAALTEFAAGGYRGASLGAIALRAGMSQSGVLRHFPSKEVLLTAVIEQISVNQQGVFQEAKAEDPDLGFLTGMVRLMRFGVADRNFTRLFTVVVAEATAADHPAHEWAVARYRRVSGHVMQALAEAQDRGLLHRDFDREAVAAELLALMDGLHLRDLLSPAGMRIDEAFADVAGQVVADLAVADPGVAAKIAAWRRSHGSSRVSGPQI